MHMKDGRRAKKLTQLRHKTRTKNEFTHKVLDSFYDVKSGSDAFDVRRRRSPRIVVSAFVTLNLSVACNALILYDARHTLNLSVPHLPAHRRRRSRGGKTNSYSPRCDACEIGSGDEPGASNACVRIPSNQKRNLQRQRH